MCGMYNVFSENHYRDRLCRWDCDVAVLKRETFSHLI